MIKILNIWNYNFIPFVDEVCNGLNSIDMVILDCVNEIMYDYKIFDQTHFNRLLDYTEKNNIPVKIVVARFHDEPAQQITHSNVEVIYWETFWFARTYRGWTWNSNHEFNLNKGVDIIDEDVCKNFELTYPFVCLNNIEKHHRSHVMDLLAKNNLLDKGAISYRKICRAGNYQYNYKHWTPEVMVLDQDVDAHFIQETMPVEFNHSFMQLVTESEDSYLFASEKTITPIFLNKPFLVATAPGMHKKLERLGFKLYTELFDYGFDDELDEEIRFQKLIDNVLSYANMSSSELKDAYNKVLDKLTYNRRLAIKYASMIPQKVREINSIIQKNKVDYSGPLNNLHVFMDGKVMKKVAMIGVGKLGQDCAEVMAEHYDVVGYDVEVRNPAFPMKSTIEEAVKDRDLIFIAAPTPHDPIYGGETPTSHLPNKDFDYTIVKNILEEVNKHVNQSQLVVLISTVLPGTVRSILRPCITNARFIYNPYLIAMGTIKWDMVNPEMVIIGTDDGSLTGDAKELIDFYKVFMANNPRYEVGTWDEAEAIKIFYNTFISTKLALVNMIQDVAETNGNMNVDIVTNALAKSTYRIMGPMYMKAALGDAGACHPRDNIALRYLADRLDLGYDLFDAIMTAREKQAERMALACLQHGKNVTIVGKAYKPKVHYTNGSASMLVGHYIEKHGGNLNYYDIHTGDTDLKTDWTQVYLIGYWEDYVTKLEFNPNAVVIDPWRTITKEQFAGKIIHYGNTRIK